MKPAGPERDRGIAEVRGDEGEERWSCSCGGTMYNKAQVHWHSRGHSDEYIVTQYTKHKPYSTDISAAMELWRDLPRGCTLYKGAKSFIVRIYKTNYPSRWECRHEGETEADAISGAYLKWKSK